MIRYGFDLAKVNLEIEKLDRKWLQKAKERTEKMVTQGFYEESSAIWSEIKPVYMALQHNKCIFCERQFESAEFGRIEHDLEHFRPKSTVDAWPVANKPGPRYDFATGERFDSGYYWLAYELTNYAAACKVCNSTFKSAFFPIAANRASLPANTDARLLPAELQSEQPLLCYPLGEFDDSPQDLITFRATTAVPVHDTGHQHRRATVIIDFFNLNGREQLHRERARMIALFGSSFEKRANGNADEIDQKIIQAVTEPNLPHAACLRTFAKTWETDVPFARQTYAQCRLLATGLT